MDWTASGWRRTDWTEPSYARSARSSLRQDFPHSPRDNLRFARLKHPQADLQTIAGIWPNFDGRLALSQPLNDIGHAEPDLVRTPTHAHMWTPIMDLGHEHFTRHTRDRGHSIADKAAPAFPLTPVRFVVALEVEFERHHHREHLFFINFLSAAYCIA